jgi:hypothetical protein
LYIILGGQQQRDHQYGMMGVYELMEGKKVNERAVWQAMEGASRFLYYAQRQKPGDCRWHWFISDRESMEAGEGLGFVKVASSALTPDKITESLSIHAKIQRTWEVSASYDGIGTWYDAPKLEARVCTSEEKRAAARRREREQEQAMAQAQEARDIKVEGLEEGQLHHDKMGVYELVDGKEVNGRGVWQQKGGWDGHDRFIYYSSTNEWYANDKNAMDVGLASGSLKVASSALTPNKITEAWQVWDGAWIAAPKMRAKIFSAEEKRAAILQQEEERAQVKEAMEQAMAQAQEVREIKMEGLEEEEQQHYAMGVYELMEGKVVNGRAVWQKAGTKDRFMYYANRSSTFHWSVGLKESMEAGNCGLSVYVISSALTPDMELQWEVWDGTKARVRVYGAEEKRAATQQKEKEQAHAKEVMEREQEQAIKQAMEQAMEQAKEAREIKVEGLVEGEVHHDKLGVYELMEEKVVNGRAVWQNAETKGYFMYYTNTKKWSISDRESMEAGEAAGFLSVASTALTPDTITGRWQRSGWWGCVVIDAKVTTRVCNVEEERQAMAQAKEARDILVEGLEEGKFIHTTSPLYTHRDKMGVYELMEDKETNGRGVWQNVQTKDYFMYCAIATALGDRRLHWFISDRESMEAGEGLGFVKVASSALTPDKITETWEVGDGKGVDYYTAPNVRARVWTAEEKRAAQRREREREQVMEQAKEAREIKVEGLEEGELNHDKLGVYELMEGKVVNGRAVWQNTETKAYFMYYTNTKRWIISDRESMEAGEGLGFVKVASSALTPDKVTETWEVRHGSVVWNDAPNVRVHVYSKEEKREAAQRREQEQEKAMEQAKEAKVIKVEGLEDGRDTSELHRDKLGVYELMEEKTVNGRGVWQKAGYYGRYIDSGKDYFVYYAQRQKPGDWRWHWFISDRESMEAGEGLGFVKVASSALTPDKATEMWEVGTGGVWYNAPKMEALRVTW